VDGGVGELDLAVGGRPAGRVPHRGVEVLQGDGEVHDVQVKVVDAPIGELLAGDGLDLVGFVEAVPELGDDEELLALDEAVLDCAGYTLAGFDFVAVVWWMLVILNWFFKVGEKRTAGTIEETVASLDGVVDLVGTGVVVDLPETEAHEGHLKAAVKLDVRDRHCE
jgi:hypothetical protein